MGVECPFKNYSTECDHVGCIGAACIRIMSLHYKGQRVEHLTLEEFLDLILLVHHADYRSKPRTRCDA